MKLTVLRSLPPQKNNGGEIGNFERFRILQALGWDVRIETAVDTKSFEWAKAVFRKFGGVEKEDGTFILDHLSCRFHTGDGFGHNKSKSLGQMQDFFQDLLHRENPDLAWCQYTDHAPASAALLWNPKRAWIDISDNEFTRVREMLLNPDLTALYPVYQMLERVVVASPFMQRVCEMDFPHVKVVHLPYPMPELRKPRPNLERKFWLFINPVEMKGRDVVIEIARRLPDENFAFVRNWAQTDEMPNLPPNITVVPQQQTIQYLFAHSKGLLMPSLWKEAFGRVPLEAMAASVPVITSDRGALPETVGSGGIVLDPDQIGEWVRVMQNPDLKFWDEIVRHGHERVKEYLLMCEGIYREFMGAKRS